MRISSSLARSGCATRRGCLLFEEVMIFDDTSVCLDRRRINDLVSFIWDEVSSISDVVNCFEACVPFLKRAC